MPISARTGSGVDAVIETVMAQLPVGPALYPEDQISDRPVRFLCAELIREELMQRLHEELPYGLTVTVEKWEQKERAVEINAVVWVSRDSHKGMVIGKSGQVLKQVGTASRRQIEEMLQQRVMLRLWVKVKTDWSDDDKALGQLGLTDK